MASCTRLACSSGCVPSAKPFGVRPRSFTFRVDEMLRELANPNLHDIPTNLPFRVEMWDRHDQHIRWVISASSSVSMGHAALDVAIANFPSERFTLRNRALVIREYKPEVRHEL